VRESPQITSEGITYLAEGCSVLAILDIRMFGSLDALCGPLSKSKSIRDLSIDQLNTVTEEDFLNIGKLSTLEHLSIAMARNFTPEVVLQLAKLTNLKSMISHPRMDDTITAVIPAFTKIEKIHFGHARITDKVLKCIGEHCPLLRDVDITNCRITDDGIYYLTSKPALSLRSVTLNMLSDLTDHSLTLLSKCANLQRLFIMGCKFVDISILTECSQLTYLNILNCPLVPRAAVIHLRNALPYLFVDVTIGNPAYSYGPLVQEEKSSL